MKIDVLTTAQQADSTLVKGKTVVVIDVLRATSVMVTALQNGASFIIPVLSPDEAFKIKSTLPESCVLGGERNAEPIAGFDYGNSPFSYTKEHIEGKALLMTTTNGTLAINNSLEADELLIGSFINDEAIAQRLADKNDILIVCSGNNGVYTLEDALCAGRLIYLLKTNCNNDIDCTDIALSVLALYQSNMDELESFASKGYHYNVLKQKGYHNDLEYCFKSNVCNAVPFWNKLSKRIVIK